MTYFDQLPRELKLEILHDIPYDTLFQSVRYVSRELEDLFQCLIWSKSYQAKLLRELRLNFYWQTHFNQRGERTLSRPMPLLEPQIKLLPRRTGDSTQRMALRIECRYPQGKEVVFSVWHNGHYRPLTSFSATWTWHNVDQTKCLENLAHAEQQGFENLDASDINSVYGCYEADLDLEEIVGHIQQSRLVNPRLYEYAEQGVSDPNFIGDPVDPHWTDQYMAGFSPHPNTFGFVWAEYYKKYGLRSRDAAKVRGWIRYNRFMMRQIKEDGVWKIGRTFGNELLNSNDFGY